MKTKLHFLFFVLLFSIGLANNSTIYNEICETEGLESLLDISKTSFDHFKVNPDSTAGDDCEPECPDDFSVQADANDQYTIPDYVAEGIVILEGDCTNAVITQEPAPGTIVGLGEIEIIVTATLNGDEEECDFDLTVVSSTGGGDCMVNCPADITVQADENGEYSLPSYFGEGLVTLTGDCFAATIDQSPPQGTIVGLGDTTITVTVSAGGNTDSCDFILTVSEILGIDDAENENIFIYPNPATDMLFISADVINATIYDLLGQVVLKVNKKRIPVSNLKAGMYLVLIETETGIATKRIVIQ